MTEIGSDFWNIEKTNTAFFLCGRTAEEYIIRDILETRNISSVLLPSLCCHTMIEPVLRHGISVRFYDVYYDEGLKADLPEKWDGEILMYLDYFGYERTEGLERANEWDVTVEDCTHSWMEHKSDADYSFVSYRKWTGFTAIARADKKEGCFTACREMNQFAQFEKSRINAMKLKKSYIEEGIGMKEKYLAEFSNSEFLVDSGCSNYMPSYDSLVNLLSIDVDVIKEKRRNNAQTLIRGLESLKGIKIIFNRVGKTDVPFNVPILVENGFRNELRECLIQDRIYCPVHWPLSDIHAVSARAKVIYDTELSLVCDQRYDTNDMEREVQAVRKFFRKK